MKIRTKADARNYLNDNYGKLWEGQRISVLKMVAGINIMVSREGAIWYDCTNMTSIRFEEVVEMIWQHRKAINKYI